MSQVKHKQNLQYIAHTSYMYTSNLYKDCYLLAWEMIKMQNCN